MSNTDVGREPVQIVRIRFPKCANTHGTAPCTATETGDAKCFNTRATCNDVSNYRSNPEGALTADLVKLLGERITSSELTRTADLFAAFDVGIPPVPSGTIWNQGSGSTDGVYLGITGSNLVFRAGDSTVSSGTDVAKITVPYSQVAGKSGTLLVAIDISANSVSLWFWCPVELCLTLLGTDTASGSFSQWADTSDGEIGTPDANVATGEDGGDWNGKLTEARFYDSTAEPATMGENDFRLDVYFGRKQIAKPSDSITIFPMIRNMTTTGSRINISGGNRTYEPLGNRATVDIDMADGLGSDTLMDPYLSDRTYDPLTQSTFWLKLRIRQKFGKLGATVVIYEGYDGDALSAMTTRAYLLERIDLPDNGSVRLYCRDVLTRSELQKAQAPEPSPGYLNADINELVTTITVAGMVDGDYPETGTIRIDEEIMDYSAIADNGDDTFDFTLDNRGAYGSEPASHTLEEDVQLCLTYTNDRIDTVLTELLYDYAGIEYQYLDLAGWESEVDSFLSAYQLTTVIPEPTSIKELIGEISEQCSFYMWWDERAQAVKMAAIRGLTNEPTELNDNEHFIVDSVTVREKPDQRLSQVWFYYNPADYTEDLKLRHNYKNVFVDANLQKESQEEYRQRQIREVFSRWLTTEAEAAQTAARLVSRYQDVPVEITFALDAKDRTYWVSDFFRLSHHKFVDANGVADTTRLFVITSAEEDHLLGRVKYLAEDTTLAGFIYVILDNAEGDYVGDGTDQFNGAWITDADGLYSNGDEGARIN